MSLIQMKIRPMNAVAIIALLFALTGCDAGGPSAQQSINHTTDTHHAVHAHDSDATSMMVYKSPTCGCCVDWIDHVEQAGFETAIEHPSDMSALKDKLGIGRQYRSCHTAVTHEGYVFEGHVPARYIEQFLANPPADALGLSVPGMPVGSPGMEMGNQFDAYHVVLLKKDGSSQLFAMVENPSQQ